MFKFLTTINWKWHGYNCRSNKYGCQVLNINVKYDLLSCIAVNWYPEINHWFIQAFCIAWGLMGIVALFILKWEWSVILRVAPHQLLFYEIAYYRFMFPYNIFNLLRSWPLSFFYSEISNWIVKKTQMLVDHIELC